MTNPPPTPSDTARLLAWLADHDETCPVCHYNLRALTRPACPECNTPVRLTVYAPDRRLGAWLAAIISFALAIGFDSVAAIIIAAGIVYKRSSYSTTPQPFKADFLFASATTICAAGIAALVFFRVRWFRLSPARQWRWAVYTFIAVLITHLLLAYYINFYL